MVNYADQNITQMGGCTPNGSKIILIMYIYHAVINTLSAHMIHINLNMIFYTHVEHSPTKTIYIKYYTKKRKKKKALHTHTHTHTHTTVAELGTDIS